MNDENDQMQQRARNTSHGYRTCTLGASSEYQKGKAVGPTAPDNVVLLDDDRYLVSAQRDHLSFNRCEDAQGASLVRSK
jgi:hypothetical protein